MTSELEQQIAAWNDRIAKLEEMVLRIMNTAEVVWMQTKMPIGVDGFEKLREQNYYFVDKTDFIRQLIDGHSEVTLITRPRRFGKTLTLSMLEWFFSAQKEAQSRDLFQGLSIEKAGNLYMQQRGKYPVLFMSFKNFSTGTWAEMVEIWRDFLQDLFLQHTYLREPGKVQPELLQKFEEVASEKTDTAGLSSAVALLMRLLHQYYGKKVILLIDEYDAPIQQAWDRGFYEDCITFMRQLLGSALKTNTDLEFAVLTGVLRVAKESIFSGLNNLKVCSVLQNDYADVFGFTNEEIQKMARDLGKESLLPDIKKWYDGYRFGGQAIYNPWSVINCFDQNELGSYWVNTSGNGILGQMLRRLDAEKEQNLLALLHGKSIVTTVQESVIYQDIDRNEDALYTMLLVTGYLTAAHKKQGISGLECELQIPNREVQDVFRAEILNRFKAGLSVSRLTKMLRNLLEGQEKEFSARLSTYLEYLASSFDTGAKESFYHGFMLGMTALLVPEYVVESNRESGYGRFDIGIFPKDPQKTGVILEFKAAASEKEMQEKAQEALRQIEEKKYTAEFAKLGIAKVWKYGVAFWGKKISIAKEPNITEKPDSV